MIPIYIRTMWWQIEKDLLRELRMARTWPAMLLLGLVLAALSSMQVVVPAQHKAGVSGGLYWLTLFFAGSIALERSLASERENGCLQSLLLYPIAPSNVYLAKVISNYLSVCLLAIALIIAFCVLSDARLLSRPLPFLGVLLLANLGFAAAGTLLSGLTSGMSQRTYLLALLTLPLLAPVVVGASEATRLLLTSQITAQWWRWIHLLIAFDVLFVVAGVLMFEFAIEE